MTASPEERTRRLDFLLDDLDRIEREHREGELGDAEFADLTARYEREAAGLLAAATPEATPPRRRRMGVLVALGVGAIGIGAVLTQNLGIRPDGGTITGQVETDASRFASCQQQSMRDAKGSMPCFDEILDEAPDDLDALTYKGWALVRADLPEEAKVLFDRVVELEPSYPDVYVFRASVALRSGDAEAAERELAKLDDLEVDSTLRSVLQQMGLAEEIAVAQLEPDTAKCWDSARTVLTDLAERANASAGGSAATSGGETGPDDLTEALTCFDDVLAARPGDSDALTLQSALTFTLLQSLPESLGRDLATSTLDRLTKAAAANPESADLLAMSAAYQLVLGQLDDAESSLARLDELGPTTPLIQPIDRDSIAEQIDMQRSAAPTGDTPDTADSDAPDSSGK